MQYCSAEDIACNFMNHWKFDYTCVFRDVDIRTKSEVNVVANHRNEHTDDEVLRAEFKMSYLSYFPVNILIKFPKLKSLKVYNLDMLEVKSGNFKGGNNLVELDIGLNKLNKLKSETFLGAQNLQKIKMDQNPIKEIDENAFKGLSALKSLNLGTNNLKSLHKNTFKWTTSLEEIRLPNNYLETLPNGLFEHNKNLKVIDLAQNKIKSLENIHMFSHLGNLNFLYLSGNVCVNVDVFEQHLNRAGLEKKLENCATVKQTKSSARFNTNIIFP